MHRRVSARLLIAATMASMSLGFASAQPLQEPPPEAPPPGAAAPPAMPTLAPQTPPTAELPPEEAPPQAPAPEAPALPPLSSAPSKPAPPKRTLYTAAVLQVLDKVTAESLRFEAPLHKFIRYKGLIFLVNTCQSSDPDQPMSAHVEIDSQPPSLPGRPPNPVKLVFRGWMFADTPGPHPFSHPVYDAWLIACKMASPGG